MIGSLRGRVVALETSCAVIDVNGVGYEVTVPGSDLAMMEEGQDVVLHTHLAVREDALTLYGFFSAASRQMFRILIDVSGVGPKAAMNILSSFSAEQLVDVLSEGRHDALQTVHGIGKKTAARLCVDLRDRAMKLKASIPSVPPSMESDRESLAATGVEHDLVSALVNLGYRSVEAEKAVSQAIASGDDAGKKNFEILFKVALRLLSPSGR